MADTTVTIDLQQELTNGIAAKLIRRKARQLVGHQNLTNSDRPDLEQELMIAVFRASRNFDPAVGGWKAFVSTIVERKSAKILRDRRAKKRKPEIHPVSLSKLVKDPDGELVPLATQIGPEHREAMTGRYRSDDFDLIDLQEVVAAVMKKLPPRLRKLCRQLQRDTFAEIVEKSGIPRTTLWDWVLELRERFEAAGLKDFFQKSSDSLSANWEV